jgi:hypothetical protein
MDIAPSSPSARSPLLARAEAATDGAQRAVAIGVVWEDGRPAAGVHVVASLDSGKKRLGTTDAGGMLVVPQWDSEVRGVQGLADVGATDIVDTAHVEGGHGVTRGRGAPATADVLLVMRPTNAIEVLVLDRATGLPVEGVDVAALGHDHGTPLLTEVPLAGVPTRARAVTGRDGVARLGGLAVGERLSFVGAGSGYVLVDGEGYLGRGMSGAVTANGQRLTQQASRVFGAAVEFRDVNSGARVHIEGFALRQAVGSALATVDAQAVQVRSLAALQMLGFHSKDIGQQALGCAAVAFTDGLERDRAEWIVRLKYTVDGLGALEHDVAFKRIDGRPSRAAVDILQDVDVGSVVVQFPGDWNSRHVADYESTYRGALQVRLEPIDGQVESAIVRAIDTRLSDSMVVRGLAEGRYAVSVSDHFGKPLPTDAVGNVVFVRAAEEARVRVHDMGSARLELSVANLVGMPYAGPLRVRLMRATDTVDEYEGVNFTFRGPPYVISCLDVGPQLLFVAGARQSKGGQLPKWCVDSLDIEAGVNQVTVELER